MTVSMNNCHSLSNKTKHIDKNFHLKWNQIKEKIIYLQYVLTKKMITGVLKNLLSIREHNSNRCSLRLMK